MEDAGIFGSVIGLVFAAFAIVLSICWLLLPFLILNSLGKLRAEVSKGNDLFRQITQRPQPIDRTDEVIDALVREREAMQEDVQRTNQLLEWLGTKDGSA